MNRILYRLLIFFLLLSAASYSYVWYSYKTLTVEQIAHMFEPITSKYGVKIVYEVDENFLSSIVNSGFPAGPSPNSYVEPIRHRVLAQYPAILGKAFSRYPVNVIKNHLSAIHFANEIKDEGFQCSGAYDSFRRVVFMVDNGGKNEKEAMRTFHHEFSSLLLSRHSLILNPWFDQNPENFVYLYTKNRNEMLKTYNSTQLASTEADYGNGFMNSYGQTNFENDFNEYAAMIFTDPQKFKKIMSQYTRVRGKFLILLEFYHRIDPIFTEEYLLGEK